MKKNKFEIGQRVVASVTRTGGGVIKIIGTVKGYEKVFGRNDIIIDNGTSEPFVVNVKNVASFVK